MAWFSDFWEKLKDRGTSRREVELAIREGERQVAKKGRLAFQKNFSFENIWKGSYYLTKQVMPIVVEEAGCYVVVTVYVFYFGGRK